MVRIFKTFWEVRKLVKRPKIKIKFIFGRKNNIGILSPGNPVLSFVQEDVTWKDKDGTPRFMFSPQASLSILGGIIQIFLELDISDDFNESQYWEQILWATHYCKQSSTDPLTKSDWAKAEETWPWVSIDSDTKEKKSSWTHEFEL